LTKSTDVIVRIGGAGVCRTDLHIIEGVWKPHMDPAGDKLLPIIMGHENAGWIEEVGKEVEGFKKGDPVIVHPKITGGTCLACRRGFDMHGPGTFPGLDCNGGYAEFLCTSERNIVPLPRTLAPKDVAPYADAGLTAYRDLSSNRPVEALFKPSDGLTTASISRSEQATGRWGS
jgi:NAD+-dependent secondary alcohol dehydrogenase Adh1